MGCERITDASVPVIGSIMTLKKVYVVESGFSPAGIAQLQQALPTPRSITKIGTPVDEFQQLRADRCGQRGPCVDDREQVGVELHASTIASKSAFELHRFHDRVHRILHRLVIKSVISLGIFCISPNPSPSVCRY